MLSEMFRGTEIVLLRERKHECTVHEQSGLLECLEWNR